MSAHTLDARGLLCPLPVIRTQNAVKKLQPGDTLEVLCSDPGAKADIPAWCRVCGHRVVSIEERGRDLAITVEVGA